MELTHWTPQIKSVYQRITIALLRKKTKKLITSLFPDKLQFEKKVAIRRCRNFRSETFWRRWVASSAPRGHIFKNPALSEIILTGMGSVLSAITYHTLGALRTVSTLFLAFQHWILAAFSQLRSKRGPDKQPSPSWVPLAGGSRRLTALNFWIWERCRLCNLCYNS